MTDERELIEKTADLENRVSELASRLADAEHEQESFVYSVSHDLRAPLRAVAGFSRILIDEYHGKLGDEGEEILQIIYDNARKLDQLIADLVTLSRTGRHKLSATKIQMDSLSREVFEELRKECPERMIEFTVGSMPDCSADPTLLRQLLTNYISNAIKFTAPRETAVIEIGGRSEDDSCTYFVKDNGVGFDMKNADRLFEVFQRLHSEKDFEGTGAGLAIARLVAKRHGGDVWAEAEPDHGATFYFSLPSADHRL